MGSAVEGTIVAAIATMASAPGRITRGALLCELDVDSLDLVELAQIVEDEHGVTLELAELRGLETVGDLVQTFDRRAS